MFSLGVREYHSVRRASLLLTLAVFAVVSRPAAARESFGAHLSKTRADLDERGVQSALIYDGEVFADISGGARRGADYLGNLNLQLTLDLERLLGWSGATIYIDGLNIHGRQPSNYASDAQGVSSIAGPNKWTLEEAWLQQSLFSGRFSFLVGRYDLNSEFDRLHAADLFFNSSFGTNPELGLSGQAGPSVFPNTAVGARLEIKPTDSLILRVAVLDGVPVDRANGWDVFARGDGLLIVSEAAYLYRPVDTTTVSRSRRFLVGRNVGLPPYQAKLAIGVWHYTASFPDLSGAGPGALQRGNTGAYLIGETVLHADDLGRELRVFSKLGIADSRVNRFVGSLSAGVTAKTFVPGRPNDEFGIGFAAAMNSSDYNSGQRKLGRDPEDAEVAVEFPYLAQITSWLSIEPDLQYVIHPNTDAALSNAVGALLRVELSF